MQVKYIALIELWPKTCGVAQNIKMPPEGQIVVIGFELLYSDLCNKLEDDHSSVRATYELGLPETTERVKTQYMLKVYSALELRLSFIVYGACCVI